jgi:L-rhamnose isomerase/sugar isomerase
MFENYLSAMEQVYAALPPDMAMFIEHKMYEPAFYSTVISDWGSSLMAAQALGPKAKCLVDLGHHAPNVNIEQIVARLVHVGRLAGFHFNDSKYGDDDLDSRLGRSVPAVPGLQRTGRGRVARGQGVRAQPT